MARLPAPIIDGNTFRLPRGSAVERAYERDLSRIRTQRTGTITLYRGEKVRTASTDGLRRLRRVDARQSWTTNRDVATAWATPARPGGGLVYAVDVPAAEFARAREGRSGADWNYDRDAGGLEVRPGRARPDLKPRIDRAVRTRTRQSRLMARRAGSGGVSGGG